MKIKIDFRQLTFGFIVLLFVFGMSNIVRANELVFQAEFFSDYPKYPNKKNKQRGTAYTYKKNTDTSIRKKFSTLASKQLKSALLANSTDNPFKSVYQYAYTLKNKRKLKNCPALSYPFELDNNSATKEWLISSSFYLCLADRGLELDSIPHMWILQKKKGKYSVLMEADGYIKIIGNSLSNYNDIYSYIYLSRMGKNQSGKCGGPMNMWTYSKGKYEVAFKDYHSDDCDFKNATGSTWVRWNKKFIEAAKPASQRIMKKLEKISDSNKEVTKNTSQSGILDIISIEEVNKLLGK